MSNNIGLSQFYEDNLRQLSDYLLKGELKADFDMNLFGDHNTCSDTDCGAIGCAVGHGPYAGIKKKPTETWVNYSLRVFGLTTDACWEWCFSPDWSEIDNTSRGAAKRILWLLENGLPSDNDLCYLNNK